MNQSWTIRTIFEQNEPFSNKIWTIYERLLKQFPYSWQTVFQIIMDCFSSKMNNFRTFCGTIFKQFVEQFSNILSNNIQTVCRTIFKQFVEQFPKSFVDPNFICFSCSRFRPLEGGRPQVKACPDGDILQLEVKGPL